MEKNIILLGVGSQGTVSLARAISLCAIKTGLPAQMYPITPLSQREGSVAVHLRLGEVSGPKIPQGQADMGIAMEILESLRIFKYLRKDGLVFINDRLILPPNVDIKKIPARDAVFDEIKKITQDLIVVPAYEKVMEMDFIKGENSFMLGVISPFLDFIEEDDVEEVLKDTLPTSLEENIEAYHQGLEFGRKQTSDTRLQTPEK